MGHGIIAWILIGIIAGWLTGKIMRGSGYGFLVDMIVGLFGALLGNWLFLHLGAGGVNDHGFIVTILISTIGAVILTFLVHLITGKRRL
jgi:uncharacterized membrane protein YeaQ/YmgE (transglycosylase-associated protein family)